MSSLAGANSQSSSHRSQKETAGSLSVFEKLDILPALITVFANTALALFTGAVYSKENRPTGSISKHVNLTTTRTLIRRTSARQQHYVVPTTDDAYAVACKSRGVEPRSEVLEDGTKAHWVGSSKSDSVILNFHGGGYVLPCSPHMFEFMFRVVDACTAKGQNVSCLILSYDLSPGAAYPRQLQQAASLLNHVLTTLSIPSSRILLSGDSAGANLVLSLLSHILHQHPSSSIPAVSLPAQSKFAGLVLISPWVQFKTSTPSYTKNKYKDCLSPEALQQWSSAFVGKKYPHEDALDNYNQAVLAPSSWWEGLPVDSVLIMAGAEEVLIDGIEDFVKKFTAGVGKDKVEFNVVQGSYHDQPSVDIGYGVSEKDEGEQAKIIKGWISSKL